ncbi:hypothetical protein AGMMS50268_39770 [Spirochaetia bacterium]|nr:hypothetical protein AGMMS50268_39770 [Spirochaetia bacterium]
MRWNVSGSKTTAGAPARLMGLFLLCSVLSLPVYSLDGEADGNGSSSGNELERLIGISERLGELNRTLRSELDDSRKSSEAWWG